MSTDEDFAALRCIVNYARSQSHCKLVQAKAYAVRQGFSQESVNNAANFWADHEARKMQS